MKLSARQPDSQTARLKKRFSGPAACPERIRGVWQSGFLLLFLILFLQVFSFTAESSFRDVPSDHWAKPSIDKLVQLKVIDTPAEGLFNGSQKMTRYELAVWMDRLNQTLLLNAAIQEKLIREFDAESAEMGREIKELKTLTK